MQVLRNKERGLLIVKAVYYGAGVGVGVGVLKVNGKMPSLVNVEFSVPF